MLVVVANDIPPAVRGRMKLWFVEPRPNVFVSGIKDSVADDVIEYLFKYCPSSSGLIIFKRINEVPYYKIMTYGNSVKTMTRVSGLQLIVEKEVDS